ncbi:MAG: VOC family protein, partial [Cyanobacteria bacterium J06642_11]
MELGYTIIYVTNVQATLTFYHEAFDLSTKFLHESGDYAELETGTTTLAFAAHALGEANFPTGYTKLTDLQKPAGIEIALVTKDIDRAISGAVKAGATIISEPSRKPWGQTVAYVRAPDGMLIELCTPVN